MASKGEAVAHTVHSHQAGGCETSGKYTEYIRSHLDALQAKCESFTACIDHLLQGENALLVLKGEDISLNKTCGLVYSIGGTDNDESYYTLKGKCSLRERMDIRNDIEHHLKEAIVDQRDWRAVKKCLGNSYGDNERSTFVDEICGLAYKDKVMCNNYPVHKRVESFFNEQIQHLKCTCDSLHNDSGDEHGASLAAILGAAIGGILFVLLLGSIFFFCYRRRRAKKKKKSPNVIYLPAPNTDNHPVYQEVFDDRPYQTHAFSMTPSSNPPTLPMRYTTAPKIKGGRQEEEPAYLEPIEVSGGSYRPSLPRRGQPASNPNYDAPPKYSERDTEKSETEDPHYFQPLPSPPPTPPPTEPGYDKLQMRDSEHRTPPEGYESVEVARSSIPLEDAPRPEIPTSDVPVGPKPGARTKKPDRQTESHYFLLEEGSQKKHSDV